MKINEIIRQKRTEKGMTQEQVALALNVSTPAVNKWEKGICYPDITLLPALARLLGTELTALLSFQDNMSGEELGSFLHEVYIVFTQNGVEASFELVREKLRDYPVCDALLLNSALVLNDILLVAREIPQEENCRNFVEDLLLRASVGSDPEVSRFAKMHLVAGYIEKKDYARAEAFLSGLQEDSADKCCLLSNLFFEQGDYAKATEIMEQKLISDLSSAQSALHFLAEVAMKEWRTEDAVRLLLAEKQMVNLFDLWNARSCTGDLQISIVYKDAEKVMDSLEEMMKTDG